MTSILVKHFAWRLRQMLAGLVLLSAAIGMVVVGATVALSVPAWMALAAYPAICSLSLLICAAVWSIRTTASQPGKGLRQRPSHG
jgi:hypothetical protein